MLRTLIDCARYEGSPLHRLSSEMKWGISFSPMEICELEKYVELAGPLETLFNALNCKKTSNIQRVVPSIQVKSEEIKLLCAKISFLGYVELLEEVHF